MKLLSQKKGKSDFIIQSKDASQEVLKRASFLPVKQSQKGMTPEQRKVTDEIMEKVFARLEAEGRIIKPKKQWKTTL